MGMQKIHIGHLTHSEVYMYYITLALQFWHCLEGRRGKSELTAFQSFQFHRQCSQCERPPYQKHPWWISINVTANSRISIEPIHFHTRYLCNKKSVSSLCSYIYLLICQGLHWALAALVQHQRCEQKCSLCLVQIQLQSLYCSKYNLETSFPSIYVCSE